eukprot:scaffold3353_cov144-Skeletonema_menzelii.AAC.11
MSSQRHRDRLNRLATQHILDDLEANAHSPRRTHSWDANSLHSHTDNEGAYANEDDFEVEYDDGVMQIDNHNNGGNEKDGQGGLWKRHHYKFFVVLLLLALAAIIGGSMLLFGPNASNPNRENDRTTNAGKDTEDGNNIIGDEEEVMDVLPTSAPTTTVTGGISYVDYYYNQGDLNETSSIMESATVYTLQPTDAPTASPVTTSSPTAAPVTNSPTAAPVASFLPTSGALTSNNETTLMIEDDNTTSIPAELTDLVDTVTTEATTTTTDATTVAATTTEATTISTTTEPASTTAATTTTIAAHLCSGTSGKIFKIDITPTSTTTSLELLQLHNEVEYKLVTAYPTADDESQELEVGVNYVKKLCVLPGMYKFVVKESDGACYNGFFRGVTIFGECGDGEYEFEFGSIAAATADVTAEVASTTTTATTEAATPPPTPLPTLLLTPSPTPLPPPLPTPAVADEATYEPTSWWPTFYPTVG